MEAKTETTTDPKRSYLCFTCEVSTPPMTETEAAAERASGHDLQPNGPSLASPDTHARYARGRSDSHKWADDIDSRRTP